jgi:hypothetical protein
MIFYRRTYDCIVLSQSLLKYFFLSIIVSDQQVVPTETLVIT